MMGDSSGARVLGGSEPVVVYTVALALIPRLEMNCILGDNVIHSIRTPGAEMRSTITARGQTVIPAEVRRRFRLGPADRLEWIIEPQGIRVVPVRADPVEAFRGQGKGRATQRLLDDRRLDARKE
jgi:AbrB family looped-hinge helix DNA binding protein